MLVSPATILDANSSRKSRGPCFTLDIAMVQPLYFVVRKCRDLDTRIKVVGEMRVGGDGIYTGRTVAKVAEWIIKTEMGVLSNDSFIPSECRLRDVHFDFNHFTRIGRV
jgi:hypothetical protein